MREAFESLRSERFSPLEPPTVCQSCRAAMRGRIMTAHTRIVAAKFRLEELTRNLALGILQDPLNRGSGKPATFVAI